MVSVLPSESAVGNNKLLEQTVVALRGKPGAVLTVLETLQKADPHNHLPRETLLAVARAMRLPLSQIYSVVSFYSFFNLKPQGEHTVTVCRGTACHTRGSRILLDTLRGTLDFVEMGEDEREHLVITTRDNRVTLRTVACFGQCAMAPVVDIDAVIYGQMNRQRVLTAVEKLAQQKGRHA